MKREAADRIINEQGLVRGNLGRKLLLAIINDKPIDEHALPSDIKLNQIEKLRSEYHQKLKIFKNKPFPRNLPFYELLKENIPNFSWDVSNRNIKITSPRVKNLRPSLFSLLLGLVDSQKDTVLSRKYKCIERLPENVSEKISELMQQIDVIYPEESEMELIVNWLEKGLNGQELTIFSPICPDYSVEPTGDPSCPFRHTFDTLGSGIGLIAQRLLNAYPIIVSMLDTLNIKLRIIIGLADFEAVSEAILKRMNLTEDVFFDYLAQSKASFQAACSFPCKVYMIMEMSGGESFWIKYFNDYQDKLNNNEFGKSTLNEKKLLDIVKKRKNLYSRWYGKKNSLKEYLPYVINQGAEYAAMGAIISKLFNNCLVLGADNDAMSLFYSIEEVTPTLYLTRYYC